MPGNYCVTITNSSGCSSVCSKIVTLGQVINCEITGDCTIPCGGQPTLLCAPAGCANYLWSNGATTSCILVSVPGNYCVTVTNLSGCSSVCSKIVTLGQVINCEITGNSTIPCGGQPILLCAPAGCAAYLWSNGATTSCIIVSAPGNYCVTVTNLSGCSSVCSKIVTVGQASVCQITGNYAIPCGGQSTLLCAPSGFASYLWSNGSTTSCIIANTAGNYCVTVTNTGGCTSTSCVTVTKAYIPPFVITGDTTNCENEPTLLCAPSGFTSYWWSTGATTSCIIADMQSSYSVTVTNANGCTNTSSITIGFGAVCNITGNLEPKQGETTVLCATANMASYLWSTGDTTRCITVNASGTYSVTIVNANGCTSSCSANVAYHIIVKANSDSLLYNTGNLQVQAYPNPFKKTSTIEFTNTESSSHVLIEVCKLTGNKISILFDRDIEQGKRYTTEFDGENLSEGVYICRIVNGNQIINKKLVLIR